jgi:hypothetical protein
MFGDLLDGRFVSSLALCAFSCSGPWSDDCATDTRGTRIDKATRQASIWGTDIVSLAKLDPGELSRHGLRMRATGSPGEVEQMERAEDLEETAGDERMMIGSEGGEVDGMMAPNAEEDIEMETEPYPE